MTSATKVVPFTNDTEEETIIIRFNADLKQSMGMGIVQSDNNNYSAVIENIEPNGQADLSNIEVGMYILTLNDISCCYRDLDWILDSIKNAENADGSIQLTLSHKLPKEDEPKKKAKSFAKRRAEMEEEEEESKEGRRKAESKSEGMIEKKDSGGPDFDGEWNSI